MRKVKELKKSLPLAAVFARLYQEEDAVFLDSSLKNNLGRYSIIGRHPYLKLIMEWSRKKPLKPMCAGS